MTVLATLVAAVLLWRGRPRLPRVLLSSLCLVLGGSVLSAWRDLAQASRSGADASASEATGRIGVAAREVFPELRRSATRLAELPNVGRGTPVTMIEPALPSAALGEAAAVVLEDGVPVVWAGLVRLPLQDFGDSLGVAHNEFYDVAYARVVRGPRAVVAMRTLNARAPADRLSRPWLGVIARRQALERVEVSRTPLSEAATLDVAGRPVLWLRPLAPSEAVRRLREEERHRALVLALVVAMLLLGTGLHWRVSSGIGGRLATLGTAFAVVGLAPLSTLSNVAPVFDPGYYFASVGGPWTASVGALAISGALACLAVFAVSRHRHWRPPGWFAMPVVMACVVGGPFLLRYLARGITLPPRGVPGTLWVAWETALFLAGVAILMLGTWAARATRRHGLPRGALVGSSVAAVAALLAPVLLAAPGRFPAWYPALWIVAMGALVLTHRARLLVLHAGFVAACGAATLTWGDVTRKRVDLAERDVAGLAVADPETRNLVYRLLEEVQQGAIPRTTSDLLRLYVGTELAAAGNPVEFALWSPADTSGPDAELVIADLARRGEGERALARAADSTGVPVIREFGSPQGIQLVLGAPLDSGHALTAVVAPRSRLIAEEPYAALLGLDVPSVVEPPYRLTVGPGRAVAPSGAPRWTRREAEFHGDWQLDAVLGSLRAHVEVDLRSVDLVLMRGTLLIMLDLVLLGALWFLLVVSDRPLRRWVRGRTGRYRRSYRARLTLALFGAFAVPSTAFAVWTLNRLRSEDAVSRSLLVQETLRAVRLRASMDLATEAERLDAPLFRYVSGELVATSDVLYARLAPLGHFLDPVAAADVLSGAEETANRRLTVGEVPTLLGYRVLADGSVLAAPARRSELTLERQQRDVLALLLFAVMLGTLAALWLSGLAARAFASPIAALQRAARDVAAGARELPSLGPEPLSEFSQVYSTFRTMAVDLSDSRLALDSARRRTEAVLRDVASGVIAVDPAGGVVLANPQAERILGVGLPAGDRLERVGDAALAERVRAFLAGDGEEDGFDLQLRGRQLRGRLTRLSRGDGGAVLTLDDVTDLARAQRVFAWGEMARQVAHEIKNPLTPIRLGVQHVRRAHADQRADFGDILERNVYRILEEIDRLDEIARSFARFGVRPDDAQASEVVNVAAVVRDVVELERMGDSGIRWDVDGPLVLAARSREGELREVLLNVLENARLAHASRVAVRALPAESWVHLVVEDDGDGIPPEALPRIFEPQFSTRTSGSGLGLAISKRLVESWGGRIRLDRREPRGTVVTIALVPAPPA